MELLLALLPIIWLLVALTVLKMPAWKACSVAAVGAFIIAILPPYSKVADHMIAGGIEGAALAIWPILLVITAAIFTYNLVVETKAMDVIKTMLSSVTTDQRVLGLLLAWGFGAFMEGMAGFGTAVAIPAAMMVAVGFSPLKSILACLVANSVPTTYGSVAIPTTTLAALTGLEPSQLATYISAQLFLLNTITPFFIVAILCGGVKAFRGVFTVTLLSGLALSIPEFIVSKFIGPELAVVVSSIIIMGVIIICAKAMPNNDPAYQVEAPATKVTTSQGLVAASPFILIFALLLGTSKLFPAVYLPLASVKTTVIINALYGNKHTFVWIATPGIMIFISAFIGGFIQKASLGKMLSVLGRTFAGLKFTYLTIIAVVVTAKIMTYSGMTANIAEALVGATGNFYPFFAPLVGALGGFITGSGTNSNVLFGPLQIAAAAKLAPGNETLSYWLAAASSGAAGTGKMFSPQSIAIAIGAVVPAVEAFVKENNITGKEAEDLKGQVEASKIMGGVAKYFILYIVIGGLVCYFGQSVIAMLGI